MVGLYRENLARVRLADIILEFGKRDKPFVGVERSWEPSGLEVSY